MSRGLVNTGATNSWINLCVISVRGLEFACQYGTYLIYC